RPTRSPTVPGETDLRTLLATLDPALAPEDYVFVSMAGPRVPRGVEAFATVREDEGVTLVLLRDQAQAASLPFEGAFARITLRVHSSLEAVGLTAAVA